MKMFKWDFLKRMDKNIVFELNKNTVIAGIAIIAVIAAGVLIFANFNKNFSVNSWTFGLLEKSSKQIGQSAVDYINNNSLSDSPVSLSEVSEESGLIKIKIKVGGGEFDSYVSKDGKLLFPQALNMSDTKKTDTQSQNNQPSTPDAINGAPNPGNAGPSCGV